MKFGKRLASQLEETLPEWRDKFLSYKQLKKRLKVISAPDCFTEAAFEASPSREGTSVVDVAMEKLANGNSKVPKGDAMINPVTEEEAKFTNLLNEELEKFNNFFSEKEEEYVIRLQELKERIEKIKKIDACPSDAVYNEELIQIRKDIVTFHGEMILLFNYSSLNYTGLVKILKKHDKHTTGTHLRLPFIQCVLHQPFFTTELLSKLVQECEKNLHSIFPTEPLLASATPVAVAPAPIAAVAAASDDDGSQQDEVESIYKSTLAALQTVKDLRKGSSTYSSLSMPPLQKEDEED